MNSEKPTPDDTRRSKRPAPESMLPTKVYLIDRSPRLVSAWREQFSDCPNVEAIEGDYFQRHADAIVSPANSFGIMDGGLDLAIRDQLGFAVESRLQEVIVEKYHGELPVGSAEIVETGDPRWRYLIAAPTMRIPEPIAFTINSYLAFRAILVATENFNKARGKQEIDSVVCSGLGTGIGKVSEAKCAGQMRAAYQVMRSKARIMSYQGIHEFHQALLRLLHARASKNAGGRGIAPRPPVLSPHFRSFAANSRIFSRAFASALSAGYSPGW